MNRIKFLSKIALAASVSLALAFTFSCSSDDIEESGSPVTGGADGGGNKNAQIYYDDSYWDDDVYHYRVGAPYTGNGIIEIASSLHCWSGSGGDGCEWTGLKAGSVTNGIVKLELPKNIPEEYLEGGEEEGPCSDPAFKDLKFFGGGFVLTNSNKDYLGELDICYRDEQIYEQIYYRYYSKDLNVKMTCDNIEYDIDAKAGWNKMYYNRRSPRKVSTKNILTKEMKWMYYNDLDD